MTRSRANLVLRRAGLHPAFAHRYSGARKGTVIGQSPRRGTRVKDGTDVRVTLSAGPAPVTVPPVVGQASSDATAALDAAKLRPVVTQVPAPGVPTGQITRESPVAGSKLLPGSTVTLSAAEAPQWRNLTELQRARQDELGPVPHSRPAMADGLQHGLPRDVRADLHLLRPERHRDQHEDRPDGPAFRPRRGHRLASGRSPQVRACTRSRSRRAPITHPSQFRSRTVTSIYCGRARRQRVSARRGIGSRQRCAGRSPREGEAFYHGGAHDPP